MLRLYIVNNKSYRLHIPRLALKNLAIFFFFNLPVHYEDLEGYQYRPLDAARYSDGI